MDKQVVFTTSTFSVDDAFEDERFMRVRIAAMHSDVNRNNSKFDKEVIEAAKDTFKNIPILADIIKYTDENDEIHYDYAGHTMHIEDDAFNEGEHRVIYDEKIVGIVPETNNFELVYNEEYDKYFAMVDALIYRDYGNYCADILEERGGMTDVSAEILVEDCGYDADEKCLVVGKMTMSGICLLGSNVNPGMEGAHAVTFSSKEDTRQEQLIQIMQELKEALDNYTKVSGKEEITMDETNLNLEEVIEEDIVDEFSEETETTPTENFEAEENLVKYSVTCGENTKEFSVSLNDKLYALQHLVNETYCDDNDYYDVVVFEDNKTVEMHGWRKSYRQSYSVKKDVYSLTGDRVEIFSKWLTQDEIAKFEKMKADFEAISDKLAKYEEEPKKMEILNSKDYEYVAQTEEFVELKKTECHFDLSVEDVEKKANDILLNAVKSGAFNFEAKEQDNIEVVAKPLVMENRKQSRYGDLFSK